MKTYRSSEDCPIRADELITGTERAILCRFGEEEIWLPLSQVIDSSCSIGSLEVSIVIPFWLVEKHGLEDYIDD